MGMEFAITFRGDHVHVELADEPKIEDPDLPGDYWEMLRKICDEHGSRRVLVEGTAPHVDLDAAAVIEAGERTSTVPDLWLAFHLDGHIQNEQSELYETVAASQGVRVKFFSNRDEALSWLRANSPR